MAFLLFWRLWAVFYLHLQIIIAYFYVRSQRIPLCKKFRFTLYFEIGNIIFPHKICAHMKQVSLLCCTLGCFLLPSLLLGQPYFGAINSASYDRWALGINLGTLWVQGDIQPQIPGYQVGVYAQKSIYDFPSTGAKPQDRILALQMGYVSIPFLIIPQILPHSLIVPWLFFRTIRWRPWMRL